MKVNLFWNNYEQRIWRKTLSYCLFFLFAELYGLEPSLLGEVEIDNVEEEELGA